MILTMRKGGNINLKKSYKARGTVWVFIVRICIAELFFMVFSYSFVIKSSNYSIFILGFLNLIVLIWLFALWFNTYYIISEEGISKTEGVIFKRTRTFDISSVSSVQVTQSVLGRILKYGSIVLENPLTKQDLILKNVNDPYLQTSLIEKQRLNEISKNPSKKVVPL